MFFKGKREINYINLAKKKSKERLMKDSFAKS